MKNLKKMIGNSNSIFHTMITFVCQKLTTGNQGNIANICAIQNQGPL